jgi:hypothetical protein
VSWGTLIEQARTSLADPDFDQRERAYKLEIADSLRHVLELARAGGDWQSELRKAFGRSYDGAQYNLTHFMQHQWILGADGDARSEVGKVLGECLDWRP